jgi:hypothetical protein
MSPRKKLGNFKVRWTQKEPQSFPRKNSESGDTSNRDQGPRERNLQSFDGKSGANQSGRALLRGTVPRSKARSTTQDPTIASARFCEPVTQTENILLPSNFEHGLSIRPFQHRNAVDAVAKGRACLKTTAYEEPLTAREQHTRFPHAVVRPRHTHTHKWGPH